MVFVTCSLLISLAASFYVIRDALGVNLQRSKQLERMLSVSCQQCCAVADSTIPIPRKDGEAKIYSDKIRNIVEEVSKLTLAEVVDLNSLLKVFVSNIFHFIFDLSMSFPHSYLICIFLDVLKES